MDPHKRAVVLGVITTLAGSIILLHPNTKEDFLVGAVIVGLGIAIFLLVLTRTRT